MSCAAGAAAAAGWQGRKARLVSTGGPVPGRGPEPGAPGSWTSNAQGVAMTVKTEGTARGGAVIWTTADHTLENLAQAPATPWTSSVAKADS